jgi:hypothetical protein
MKLPFTRWQKNKLNKQRKQARRNLKKLTESSSTNIEMKKGHPSPYSLGLRFCDRCGEFVKPWFDRYKKPQCFVCHTFLRVKARRDNKNVFRY